MIFFPYRVDVFFSRRPWGSILTLIACSLASITVPVLLATETITREQLNWVVLDGWNPLGWIAHIFIHVGLMHLAWNMYYLWIFGNAVCEKVGDRRFPLVFVALGVVGGLLHVFMGGGAAVGASGAVTGLIGMYFVLHPTSSISVFYFVLFGFRAGVFELAGYWLILFWFAMDLWGALAGQDTGIAYWAHVGGFLFGMALASTMLKRGWIVMHELDDPTLLDRLGWGRPPVEEVPASREKPRFRLETAAAEKFSYELDCPHCEQRMEVAPELLGTTFDCPHCDGPIELAAE